MDDLCVRENEGECEASHDNDGCDEVSKIDSHSWLVMGKIV